MFTSNRSFFIAFQKKVLLFLYDSITLMQSKQLLFNIFDRVY